MDATTRRQEEANLIQAIKDHLADLEQMLARSSDHWGYEDPVYRFYHQSFKVFHVQETTRTIVAKLQSLAPHLRLNPWFCEIVEQGTGKTFTPEDNNDWPARTRALLEAFFHARFFLEMICRYGRALTAPPDVLPSGWAAVLYLYNLR